MITAQFMKRFVRRLHRSIFHTVPNDGSVEVDLSRLQPAWNDRLEVPIFAMHRSDFQNHPRRLPEPWDVNDKDR